MVNKMTRATTPARANTNPARGLFCRNPLVDGVAEVVLLAPPSAADIVFVTVVGSLSATELGDGAGVVLEDEVNEVDDEEVVVLEMLVALLVVAVDLSLGRQ